MARSTAVERRLEKSLASSKKRAADLRSKLKQSQPLIIGSTITGGFLAGVVEKNNPLSQFTWAQNPELVFGIAGVLYGLTSRRAGQTEKVVTAASTGMLTVYAYKQSLSMEY
jgi:hypothetical protein